MPADRPVLVIDNFDSFVYNLVQYLGQLGVRCVGNVLLLQGRTYSPPFVITAIGDVGAVRAQLAASPQVAILQQAVQAFGLTFTVRARDEVTLPAYAGSLDLAYATGH